jgi:hypothetical protein
MSAQPLLYFWNGALLTDWIDGSVKPSLPGVYMRKWPFNEEVWFFRFDGRMWRSASKTPLRASTESDISTHQHLHWRGLAHDPALSEGRAA